MPIVTTAPRAVPLLLLDVDGTVRHGKEQLGRFVNRPADVVLFPEAVDRMREWKAAGGRIATVSNQGGIALGLVDRYAASRAMDRVRELAVDNNGVEMIDLMVWCVHHPDAGPSCWCRKPQPGMLYRAVQTLSERHFDTEHYPRELALMVGDRVEDRQCAEIAGVQFLPAYEWREFGAEKVTETGSQ